jgi:hypothetical protein
MSTPWYVKACVVSACVSITMSLAVEPAGATEAASAPLAAFATSDRRTIDDSASRTVASGGGDSLLGMSGNATLDAWWRKGV